MLCLLLAHLARFCEAADSSMRIALALCRREDTPDPVIAVLHRTHSLVVRCKLRACCKETPSVWKVVHEDRHLTAQTANKPKCTSQLYIDACTISQANVVPCIGCCTVCMQALCCRRAATTHLDLARVRASACAASAALLETVPVTAASAAPCFAAPAAL